jgi:hypothetical protein
MVIFKVILYQVAILHLNEEGKMKRTLVLSAILMIMACAATSAFAEEPHRLLVTHQVLYNGTEAGFSSAAEAIKKGVEEDIRYYQSYGLTLAVHHTIYTDAITASIYQVGDLSKKPPPLKAHPLPREQ